MAVGGLKSSLAQGTRPQGVERHKPGWLYFTCEREGCSHCDCVAWCAKQSEPGFFAACNMPKWEGAMMTITGSAALRAR
eukprot:6464793-Amphidinium_carterae.1